MVLIKSGAVTEKVYSTEYLADLTTSVSRTSPLRLTEKHDLVSGKQGLTGSYREVAVYGSGL